MLSPGRDILDSRRAEFDRAHVAVLGSLDDVGAGMLPTTHVALFFCLLASITAGADGSTALRLQDSLVTLTTDMVLPIVLFKSKCASCVFVGGQGGTGFYRDISLGI